MAPTETLLQTKLYIPPLRPNRVPRPRLLERLNQGLELGHKLTLVSAPAGYGKTTLISEWISNLEIEEFETRNSKLESGTAWLSLDEKDNDPARFLAFAITALQTVEQSLGRSAQTALRASPMLTESALTTLINDIAAAALPLVLVLDDYHLITTADIHQALIFLLSNAPPNLHLAITSRADPPLQLAGWRARGQITELRQADLSFSVTESEAFLKQQPGVRLTAAQSTLLAGRTEGWIAGLQLATLALQAHLSLASGYDTDRFLQAFAGDDRYVFDYLSAEIIQQQPVDVQEFLLKTSILKRLSGPLVDTVTGRDDGQQLLARLEQANLFLFPLDNQRRWYRYHQLFADVLQSRLLSQLGQQEVVNLHRRAAAWYEQHGPVDEAIEHALAAADFELAARLISGIANDLMYRSGEAATLRRWLAALPEELVRSRPQLLLILAWMHLWLTKPDEVERYLLALPPDPLPADIQSQVAVLRAQVAGQRGDGLEAITQAREALSLLSTTDHRLRGLALAAMGVGHRTLGEVRPAASAFAEATADFQAADLLVPTLLTLTNQGTLQVAQGRLRQADAIYHRAKQLAAEHHALKLPAAGAIYIASGELLYEWNKLEQAREHLRQGTELCQAWPGFAEETLAGLLSLAHITLVQGDVQEAMDLVQQAEQLVQEFGIAQWSAELANYRADLWLALGNIAEAAQWAAKQPDLDPGLSAGQREQVGITLARLHLHQGQSDQALARLASLLPPAEVAGRINSLLAMYSLRALAYHQQRNLDQALIVLNRALTLAEPEGYVRLFLDHGAPMASLLERALSQELTPEYTSRLLAAFAAEKLSHEGSEVSAFAATLLVEPLTDRELEVLQLIGNGLSNPEIARELVIAVTTVKTHVQNIYGKLNVSNRFQAIERARELRLL